MSEIKLYPFTGVQMTMVMNYNYSYKKSIVNIAAAVDFYSELEVETLLEAIKTSLRRNRSANYRLKVKDKKWFQYFQEDVEPEGIEIVDLSNKTDEQREKLFEKWSSKAFPKKSQDVQLYRVKLVKRNDGFYSLYLCVSHFIFDAHSIMAMVNDFFVVYKAMLNGEEPAPCLLDPIEAYEQDYKYKETNKFQRDLKYWRDEVFPTEPHFSLIGGSEKKEYNKDKNPGTFMHLFKIKGKQINLEIDSDIVTKVNEYAAANGMSPQNVYFAAIRNYLSMVCDKQEDITMMNNLSRRGSKTQKNAGGVLVVGMPMRTIMPNDTTTFADACRIYNQTCQKNYLHGNFTYDENSKILRSFGMAPLEGYYSVSTTYQYALGIDTDGIKYAFHRVGNGSNVMPLYLTMMPKDNFTGKYLFNYEYVVGYTNPDDIYKLHDYIINFVTKGIDNPELTLSQLM